MIDGYFVGLEELRFFNPSSGDVLVGHLVHFQNDP